MCAIAVLGFDVHGSGKEPGKCTYRRDTRTRTIGKVQQFRQYQEQILTKKRDRQQNTKQKNTHARTPPPPPNPPPQTHTHTHTYMYERTHARTHAAHARTHAHIHTHARTHARTHAHVRQRERLICDVYDLFWMGVCTCGGGGSGGGGGQTMLCSDCESCFPYCCAL